MSTLDNPIPSQVENVSPWSIALRYGGLTALGLVVLGLVSDLLGYTDPSRAREPLALLFGLLSYVIWIAGIVMAVKAYRTEIGGYISFGKAFRSGFFTALVIAIISMVWTFIFTNLVRPDFYTTLLDGMRDAMEEQGAPEESIDMMMGFYEFMFSPAIGPLIGLVSSIVGGAIVALVIGAIMKKEEPQTT